MFQSIWVLGILSVIGSVALSTVGLWLVRRFARPASLRGHHDVAGFLLAIVGVIYAVLLAFVVIVVWEQFEDARGDAEREANALMDVYRMSYGFSEPSRTRVRREIRAYARSVVDREWDAMEQGKTSPETARAFDRLWVDFTRLDAKSTREDHLLDNSLDRMNDVSDARRSRLLASRDGLPEVIWTVLILGAVGTMLFTYFFGLEKFVTQAAMTGILAALIALVLLLISALNYPFSGDVKVQPEGMLGLLHRLSEIESNETAPEVS